MTDSLGNQTEYHFQTIWGAKRITKISGCSTCGGGAARPRNGATTRRVASLPTRTARETSPSTPTTRRKPGQIEAPVLGTGARHTTEMTYDANGRLVSRIAPNLSTTTWTHVAAGPETITEEVSSGVDADDHLRVLHVR